MRHIGAVIRSAVFGAISYGDETGAGVAEIRRSCNFDRSLPPLGLVNRKGGLDPDQASRQLDPDNR
jgi:hypothetical protein